MALLLFLLTVGGIIYFVVYTRSRRKARQKELYEIYQSALASGNKGHASLAGRTYYSYLRKGMPTLADEEAILKDIIEMK